MSAQPRTLGARSPRGPLGIAVATSCALGLGHLACWDFEYVDPPADASTDAPAPPSDARVPCIEGGYYCGGERVAGDPKFLYRCNADGSGTVLQKCANTCVVSPTRKDDACSAATSCVAGDYCGGNKVNGDPNVLYVCNAGGSASVKKPCPNGCQINPGVHDTCK